MSEVAIIPPIKRPEQKPEKEPELESEIVDTTMIVDSSLPQVEVVEDQSVATEGPPLQIADEKAPPTVNTVVSTSTTDVNVTDGSESFVESAEGSTTDYLQGVTYASFILTFCLAGFAAVVVFRKSLKTPVKRFSMGAKVLALAYFVLAFFGSFSTYIYSRYLNGGETFFSLAVPMFSWILVGPAIAMVLNSLLTRKDKPEAQKIFFDVFTYLVIFCLTVASQVPFFEAREPLIFSTLGVIFFLFPIVRFLGSLKTSRVVHPELREMFVQILVFSLIFLPLLLPSLALTSVFELIEDNLTLLLFNSVTFTFILMTGLLMVISIDYVTQGIGADKLVAQNTDAPLQPSGSMAGNSEAASVPSSLSTETVSPLIPEVKTAQNKVKPAPEKASEKEAQAPVDPLSPVAAKPQDSSVLPPPVVKSSGPSKKLSIPSENSVEADEDIDDDDPRVIKFDAIRSSGEGTDKDISRYKETKLGSGSEPESGNQPKKPKKPKLPKAPKLPVTPKPTDSKSHAKPPEKPKKRF